MTDCIYRGFCNKPTCDCACPTFAETTYLLERNGISDTSSVFNDKLHSKYTRFLDSPDKFSVIVSDNTVRVANLLVYNAICDKWKGNQFHCNVYHLRFSVYIDSIQKSWGLKEMPESLEYAQIWMRTAEVLVISNIDFVQFKDFQAQTLLNLLQLRAINNLKTIIVSPKISTLIGQGLFFSRLQNILGEGVVK